MYQRLLSLAIILSYYALPITSAFNIYDDNKRQDMIPIPRVGRTPGYFADGLPRLSDINFKRQGLIPFPRVGRSSEEDKRQDLIPFPRVGRRSGGPDFDWTEVPQESRQFAGYVMMPYKRSPFTPRLGRKKRSLDGTLQLNSNKPKTGHKEKDDKVSRAIAELAQKLDNTPWAILTWKDGRDSKSSQDKPKNMNVRRTSFSPRLGRRSDYSIRDEADIDNPFEARTGRSPFTPRMGRSAPYSPRLGRSTD